MLLEGKTALVTGGSRGIGKENRNAVPRRGRGCLVCKHQGKPPRSGTGRLRPIPGKKDNLETGDVGDEERVQAIVKEVLEEAGALDILINNAGITRDGLIFRMSKADWEQVMKINLESAFLFCRPIARQMVKQKKGSIINISSVVGVRGNGGQCNYSASKAGLIGLTKSLPRRSHPGVSG